MKDKKPGNVPDWEGLEGEVVSKIRYLKASFDLTSKDKKLHNRMFNDLYLPNLSLLADFCLNIQEFGGVK